MNENPYHSPQPYVDEPRAATARPLWVKLGLWPYRRRNSVLMWTTIPTSLTVLVTAGLALLESPAYLILLAISLTAYAWCRLAIRWVDKYDEWDA